VLHVGVGEDDPPAVVGDLQAEVNVLVVVLEVFIEVIGTAEGDGADRHASVGDVLYVIWLEEVDVVIATLKWVMGEGCELTAMESRSESP
jgi:hypothetical protein